MKIVESIAAFLMLLVILLATAQMLFSGNPTYDNFSQQVSAQGELLLESSVGQLNKFHRFVTSQLEGLINSLFRRDGGQGEVQSVPQNKSSVAAVSALQPRLPVVGALNPQESEPRHKYNYRMYEADMLGSKAIQYDAQSPFTRKYKAPLPLLIRFSRVDVLIFRNPVLPLSRIGEGVLSADYRYPPLIVFCDKKGGVIATFQSQMESRLGGTFSAPVFSRSSRENLVWSTHAGGADMRFDHFLFDVSDPEKINVYFDFVRNSASNNIQIKGRAEVLERALPFAPEYGGRGHFLTLPKNPREQDDYRPLAQLANLKFGVSFFTLGEFPNISHKEEESFVLMQMDPSRISFFPERAERFVYRAIELRDGSWHDASEAAGAKAFYAAISNFIFHELSALDGQERNWMLTSWAAYKAMLGEWGSFRETFIVKSDETAFRRSLCQLYALVEEAGTPNLEILKTLAYLKQERNEKEEVDLTECEGQRLIEFIEWEMKGRRILGR